MANMAPTRMGQINQSGDTLALFLKVFGGEVLTAFAEHNKALAYTLVRTITSGKSAQFPVFGKGSAAYHTPGTQLVGTLMGANERTININDKLIADRFIADVDEYLAHYDIRGPVAADCGRALSAEMDKNLFRVGFLAARATATVTGGFGGTTIAVASVHTSATVLQTALFAAAQALREKDVPVEDNVCFLPWSMYYMLINSTTTAVNRDYGNDGNGSTASGTIYSIAGIKLIPTNNLPTTNVTTGLYQGDFTKSKALVMHKSAIGTVKLMDLQTESEYLIEYQGYLTLAKYMVGHGILRPEAAVEIAIP